VSVRAPSSGADVLPAARAALVAGQRAWLVGGCLRDELLGRPFKDVDIVVDGEAEALAKRLADLVEGAVYPSSDAFGTWRVLAGAVHVDIAPLRAAPGEHRPGVAGDDLTADLLARDVTINAMARPLTGGELIDPLGGAADLRAARLRLCAPGALEADPLRIVRLARLAHGLGMTPDAEAVAAAAGAVRLLSGVSGERLRDELSAVLALTDGAAALGDLAAWGALARVLPEVDALRGVEQNAYHHRDVFGHTLEAMSYVGGVVEQMGGVSRLTPAADTGLAGAEGGVSRLTPAADTGLAGAEPLVPVTWAVLLHDIGKPAARTVGADGRVVFWSHDEIGGRLVEGVAARLRMSGRFAAFLDILVRQHLRLGFLVREQPLTRRALARYRRDVSPWVFESVVVSLCDRLATRGEKTSPTSIARHYRTARLVWTQVNKAPIPRLLSGEDVMRLLRLEPGPAVGLALEALDEEVDAGEVQSAAEARAFLIRWWMERCSAQETGRARDGVPQEEPDA
jgi:poly(A) polymerase